MRPGHVPGHAGQIVPNKAGRTPPSPIGVSRPDVPVGSQGAAQLIAALDIGAVQAKQCLRPFSGTPKDAML